MRGQQIEEVVTKSEYTSAVSFCSFGCISSGLFPVIESQETGAVLKDEEIDYAFKFGNDSAVPNILERNWWETNEHAEEQRALADEALRLDRERRIKEDEDAEAGEEEEEEKEVEEKPKGKIIEEEAGRKKVVAKTRVGSLTQEEACADDQLRFTPEEIAEFRSFGLPPRMSCSVTRSR